MRVNLVGKGHSAGRGVGFYATNLTKALENNDIVITSNKPDILHYPFFDLFYPTLPLSHLVPTVVTIHDLTPLVLSDLYPQGFRAKLSLLHQQISALRSSMIITDSYSSRKDLIRFFHLPDDKIAVTPLAVDELFALPSIPKQKQAVQKKYSLPDKFALYVGGANPNKNLLPTIKACSQNSLPLVLVGSEFTKDQPKTFSIKSILGIQPTHPEEKTIRLVKTLIDGKKLISLGFVPTPDLVAIYQIASVSIHPSFYEGFGIPLLEAMTAGCLSLSSNTSSLRELATPSMLTFDPYDQSSIFSGLKKALCLSQSQKSSIIKSAKQKSKEYSWDKTAKLTIQAYKQAMDNK